MTLDSSVIFRRELGEVLREERDRQSRTLREVSTAARVSLGYLSEVERGLKEASSELLAAICSALRVPMSLIIRATADRIAIAEGAVAPDYLPANFADGLLSGSTSLRELAWQELALSSDECACKSTCVCDELALVS